MADKDLESGLNQSSESKGPQQTLQASASSSRPATTPVPSQPEHDLKIFQTLVGIHFLTIGGGPLPASEFPPKPASPLMDIFRPAKASKDRFRNRGLYDRALSHDLKYRVLYTLSSYIISGLYIFQITLAATFTALSAYQSSLHVVLTVLGALNTVIAGVLAWLTGQGMPVRFRRARDRYREVVKAIETSERMFAEMQWLDFDDDERPTPRSERDRLDSLFEDARMDQEANYPEVHYDPSSIQTQQHNEELRDRATRMKQRKEHHEGEVEALREELRALKGETAEKSETIKK